MIKSTGPFGRSTPDAEPPEYDHIYRFRHRVSNLYLELYPNRVKNGRVKFSDEGIIWNLSKNSENTRPIRRAGMNRATLCYKCK